MKRQRIFCSCILPEDLIIKHGLSSAGCNFSFNLISGEIFDKVYSIMPLYVGGNMDAEAFNDSSFELIYDKFRRRRGIWQKVAVIKEQWKIFNQIPRNSKLWFYNINTLNALLFILLKFFKPSVQLNVIVLDFIPVLKGIGLNNIYIKLINVAYSRICLAHSTRFKSDNSITLPGIVPKRDENHPVIEQITSDFLISGTLTDEISMLPMLLKAFEKMPNITLHITGTTPYETLIKQYSNICSNIIYYGMLSYESYLKLLHKTPFLLSTRNPNYPENSCNFPSKIIEALLHNRIIISTLHYKQLCGIHYFEVPTDIDGFIASITHISTLSLGELKNYANQSTSVKNSFNTDVWKESISKLENRE